MRKLKLQMDRLEVQSFETDHTVIQRGTVAGNESTGCTVCNWTEGGSITCQSGTCTEPPQETCYKLCPVTTE